MQFLRKCLAAEGGELSRVPSVLGTGEDHPVGQT
jgi:hypothetical protein